MEARNCKLLGHLDIPGGGQVVVQGGYVYIDHLKAPLGTSIVDVSDPKHPRLYPIPKSRRGHTITRSACAAISWWLTSNARAMMFTSMSGGLFISSTDMLA